MKKLALLILIACGGPEESTDKPWSGAYWGYRCFPEEAGDVRCSDEGDGAVLRCGLLNRNWPDYHVWLKTESVCQPPSWVSTLPPQS